MTAARAKCPPAPLGPPRRPRRTVPSVGSERGTLGAPSLFGRSPGRRRIQPVQDQAQAFGADWSASLRRGTEDELQGWLGFALGCCDAADEIALASFKREMDVSTKPDRTLVTQTDRAIEQLIRDEIQRTYPGHGLVGEEYG